MLNYYIEKKDTGEKKFYLGISDEWTTTIENSKKYLNANEAYIGLETLKEYYLSLNNGFYYNIVKITNNIYGVVVSNGSSTSIIASTIEK
jgi:hypothetical protein